LTGAGPAATEALKRGEPAPPLVQEAMTAICDQAAAQGTRLWIDAEQQIFQHTIDTWTISLMRKYNQNGKALVYNTCQAYLKGTPANIARLLKLAQTEGWTLGIKLVRGAYIAIEQRDLIHDTIEDTHAAYNTIVQNLLSCKFPGLNTTDLEFPSMQLFLASHNSESVSKGYETWKDRKAKGLPTVRLEIGQLQGMADEVSCGLVQTRREMEENGEEDWPRAFKCLCWGKTQETVQFLVRRVTENRGSLERTREWMGGLKREVWRRVWLASGIEK
jgi:proline dehydrogenase